MTLNYFFKENKLNFDISETVRTRTNMWNYLEFYQHFSFLNANDHYAIPADLPLLVQHPLLSCLFIYLFIIEFIYRPNMLTPQSGRQVRESGT